MSHLFRRTTRSCLRRVKPDTTNGFGKMRRTPWRRPAATLHGVVFDIFLNGHGSQAAPGLFLLQVEEMVDAQGIEPWTSPV